MSWWLAAILLTLWLAVSVPLAMLTGRVLRSCSRAREDLDQEAHAILDDGYPPS